MKNHLTDEQIIEIKNKFEDNIFSEAYYASDDEFSELFGSKNKKGKQPKARAGDEAIPKKRFDLKKIADGGLDLIKKAGGLLKGNQAVVSGDYEGTKYEASVSSEKDPPKDKPKEILGMPQAVFYTIAAVLLVVIILVVLKLAKSNNP